MRCGKTAELEIFVHTAETSLFSAGGRNGYHYQGRVISYGLTMIKNHLRPYLVQWEMVSYISVTAISTLI